MSDDEWGSLWEEVLQEDAKAKETEATTSSQMSEPPSKKGDTVRTENNQEAVELGEGREVSATVEAVEEHLQDLLLAEQEVMEVGEVTTMGGQMEMEGKITEAEGELQDADLGLKKAEENVPATRISSTEGEVGMEARVNKKPQKFIFEYWAFSQKSYLNGGCFEEIHNCIPKILYLHTS